jgi:DNA-binding NtrC family response regulator
MNKRISRVSPAATNQLQQQPWVGNVRELENAIERAMVVAREPELREEDFILKTGTANNGDKTLEDIERAHILRVLEECGENQSQPLKNWALTGLPCTTNSRNMAGADSY